jgi:hypothetical protein
MQYLWLVNSSKRHEFVAMLAGLERLQATVGRMQEILLLKTMLLRPLYQPHLETAVEASVAMWMPHEMLE